jgi:hypothetical protein
MLNVFRFVILGTAVVACGCADNEFAAPSLLVRTAQAEGAVVTPAESVVRDDAKASATGPAALHGYRDDVDPSHAAIASYRD